MAVAAEEDHSFTPSNAYLVDRCLRAKIDSGRIRDDANAYLFHDADVCSARPHDLVLYRTPAREPCRDAGEGTQWYFFNPARCGGKSLTRRSRTVDGTGGKESWHAEGRPVAVEGSASGGFVRKFSYHIRTASGVVEKPGWIMAEYTVNDTRAGDLVLCKVYKSPRGPGRSRACSSSSASSAAANSGCKRKATDDDEHLEAVTPPSTRPRHNDDDDIMLLAEDIERDLLSHDDHMTAPEFVETAQHVEESQPEPQLAQESFIDDGKMSFEEIEANMMADVDEDETMLRVPDGEDPKAFYMRFLGLLDGDQQPQEQDAFIQTVHGPRSEEDVIAFLATGVTVDELLLGGPFMSCPHPGGAHGVLCA